MIRNSTLVYLLLLLVLVGAYFFLKNREKPADALVTPEPGADVAYVFSAELGTPSNLRLEAQSGEVVEIGRDAGAGWVLKQPVEAEADQAAAEAAATQLVSMAIVDTVPGLSLADAGLDNPQYVLSAEFAGGTEETLEIGNPTPSGSGYYARNTDGEVIIISPSAVEALLGLLLNPPYLETPTPGSIPATSTPETG